MASNELTVAVAGLGNAGATLHLPALRGIQDCRIVGACDLSPEARDEAARAWEIPVYAGYAEMLEAAVPDVVVVATPPGTHRDFVVQGLRAGAHVVCEKPFVSSVREAEAVIAEARTAGRGVALNHEFREMPIFKAVRGQVASGEDGRLRFVQIWQLMDLPPWKEPGWRGQLVRRTLFEAGVHLIDYAMALFEEKPVAVQAFTSTCGAREEETDALATVTLEFSDGRAAQIVQNRLCTGATHYFDVRADLERASLRASFGGRARVTAGLLRSTRPHARVEFGVSGMAWKEVGSRRKFLARNPRNPGMVATRSLLERTLDAFRAGSEPPVSATTGRDVLEVIAACYHAAETGRRVRLDGPGATDLSGFALGTVRPEGA